MSLRVLTDAREISAAYARFARHLESSGDIVQCVVGYQGGNVPGTVRWFGDVKFWAMLQPDSLDNRYWCAFGVEAPKDGDQLSITCEINPPREGTDRRCAGVFVRSDNGTIYLAHSGKVGGGRPGVGRTSFLEFYGDYTLDEITWPDRKTGNYIVIGALDDDEFRSLLGGFVHKVAEFKAGAVRTT
jgi:hypothetical protein